MIAGIVAAQSLGTASAGYLDALAALPRTALSLRKIVSTAALAVRVRRSSDNAEQDIGFSGAGLDTGALLTFVGGGSGYVRTWYDQSGNAQHGQQANVSLQPRIVASGIYDGALVFNATHCLKVTGLILGTPQVGVYTRYVHTSTSGTQVVFEMTTVGSSNTGTWLIYTNAGATVLDSYNTSGSTNRARSTDIESSVSALQTYLMDRDIVGSAELAVFKGGAVRTSSEPVTHEQTGNYVTNDLYIGARAETSLFSQVKIESAVIYNTGTAPIRTSIEAAL